MERLSEGIEYEIKGTKLILEISLDSPGTPSASGKTIVVASTRGNIKLAGGHLGLNFYRYAESK